MIDAKEARKISEANRQGDGIGKFVAVIDSRIAYLAEDGDRSFNLWECLRGLEMNYPTQDERMQIRRHYVDIRKFTFQDHLGSETEENHIVAYTTLSW